jgi:ATP-dependent 26S proteasome regulatory subunit
VLATNRKVSLDPALERRITLKVNFEAPNREERLAIWRRMIPAKMPLADDVDLDLLSVAELTGGEIKNVLLNASRLALGRGSQGPVTMNDFSAAVRMEKDGAWSGNDCSGMIGFQAGIHHAPKHRNQGPGC